MRHSYDAPEVVRACSTIADVEQLQASVKPPCRCNSGDPDLAVWWACEAILNQYAAESAEAGREAVEAARTLVGK